MSLTDATAAAALDFEGGRMPFLALHFADPGATGSFEASGFGYARRPIIWHPAAGNEKDAEPCVFPAPPAGTWYWGGYWSAPSGGVFRGGFRFTLGKSVTPGDSLSVAPWLSLVNVY